MALYPLLRVDGRFGDGTAEYFQRYMKVKGFYYGIVDGAFGGMSWQGVQRLLKYHGRYSRAIDGDPGNYTWDGLCDFVGFDFSGTNYMPEWRVGRYWHSWSSELTKGLQHGLNVNARYRTTTYPRNYYV